MKWLAIFLFSVLCKPGTIYEMQDPEYQDAPSTQLQGPKDSEYYYFDLEYESGVYLYISNQKDSVWFYIEGKEFYYDSESEKNEEFVVQK